MPNTLEGTFENGTLSIRVKIPRLDAAAAREFKLESAAAWRPNVESVIIEATRLLFNRGTGLYFSARKLADESTPADSGFIERNHAKVRLALADAILALNGRHHFSCRTRHERIAEPLAQTPPCWPPLKAWHADAVDFKFHPRHENPPLEILRERQRELTAVWTEVFLWLESRRLHHDFRSAEEYAAWSGRLFPEFPRARNFLLHLRDRLRRGKPPRGWLDYPRAALHA